MCMLHTSQATPSQEGTDNDVKDMPSLVPDDRLSQAAYEHAKAHLHPVLLAHSMRVFFYAVEVSKRITSPGTPDHDIVWHLGDRLPLLFAACIFHDFGTTQAHDNGPWRFEVEGADAAVAFLESYGVSKGDAHAVWTAIALHISPHIGEKISRLAKILRLAPQADWHRDIPGFLILDKPLEPDDDRPWMLAESVKRVETMFPRGPAEKVLSDMVVAQACRPGMSSKAPPYSWSRVLVEWASDHPDWTGTNGAF